MSATLYDDDVYAWSQEQAALLRRLAQTTRGLPNELDLEHVAEEIEDLGRSELRAAESFLRVTFVHLIKCASAPAAPSVGHWRAEIRAARIDFRKTFTRSMGQRIDIDEVWRDALDVARERLRAEGASLAESLPQICPFTFADLTDKRPDIEVLLARLPGPA